MARDKINMPMGSAGITRYFDEYKSKIQIKPGHVVAISVFLIILLLVLQLQAKSWFGVP